MNVTHLPREAVTLLNALGRPGVTAPELEAARRSFAELRAHVVRWQRFHGAYTLHDREAVKLANVGVLWDEIDRAVEDSSRDRLAPLLYEAIGAMERVLAERQRPHFSLQPAVNDFVMAAASVVLGRGEWRAVHERLPIVQCWLDNVLALYDGAAARLRPQVASDLERGCTVLVDALARARAAAASLDSESLREAAFRLQSGAMLAQHFVDWIQRDDARLAEQYTRFRIPVAGPMLEHCLVAARGTPRSAWGGVLRHIERVVLPRLQASWAHARGRALLPRRIRERRLAAVDSALEALAMALEGLRDATCIRREALEATEAALETLSRAFAELDRDALRREPVRGCEADDWYELLAGALSGTVPDIALARALQQVPPRSDAVRQRLQAWLSGGDAEALSEALEQLVAQAPSREQPTAPAMWVCSCCGAENASGEGACTRCQRRPETLMTASWEA